MNTRRERREQARLRRWQESMSTLAFTAGCAVVILAAAFVVAVVAG